MEATTKKCPYCAEEINVEAIKCKHCGEILDADVRAARSQETPQQVVYRERKWSPGVAALLSFLIPGAGQMYKGQVGTGLIWFFAVGFGYVLFIFPGMILHLICIVMATQGDPYR